MVRRVCLIPSASTEEAPTSPLSPLPPQLLSIAFQFAQALPAHIHPVLQRSLRNWLEVMAVEMKSQAKVAVIGFDHEGNPFTLYEPERLSAASHRELWSELSAGTGSPDLFDVGRILEVWEDSIAEAAVAATVEERQIGVARLVLILAGTGQQLLLEPENFAHLAPGGRNFLDVLYLKDGSASCDDSPPLASPLSSVQTRGGSDGWLG